MTESPELHRLNTQPVRTEYDFEGCAGDNLCKQIQSPVQLLTPPRQAGRTSEISPFKSYAEAVTGSPSPSLIRDRSSDDVNSETNVQSDNLSSSAGNVINEISDGNIGTDQISIPTTIGPSTNITRKRWTKVEQVELFKCYYEALKLGLSQTNGTFEVWRKKPPSSDLI